MIEWLRRVDGNRPFLRTSERVWTYRETCSEVQDRVVPETVILGPELTAESVFGLLAGMAGGGAVVASEGIDVPDGADTRGTTLVVYTSGTTGQPKGVRFTHSNLEAASDASMSHLGHGRDDTWLLAMPLAHVGGLSILVRSAYAGGSVRMLPRFDVKPFTDAMRDVTMVSVVPTMLHRILDRDSGPYEGLKAVLVGGGPIPHGLLERGREAGLPVLPTYGMTETFGQLATLRPGAPLTYRAHPLPGVEVRLEPDGRIAVRGDQVSPGYLNEPDRQNPWFVTSDLGELDQEGALRVLGRADLVIVTGGKSVDPLRVEAELLEHPQVDETVVIGLPDPEWGRMVSAVYSGEAMVDEVDAWLRKRLPGFMIPKRWLVVEAIPRTSLGKPDRSAAVELCS